MNPRSEDLILHCILVHWALTLSQINFKYLLQNNFLEKIFSSLLIKPEFESQANMHHQIQHDRLGSRCQSVGSVKLQCTQYVLQEKAIRNTSCKNVKKFGVFCSLKNNDRRGLPISHRKEAVNCINKFIFYSYIMHISLRGDNKKQTT